MVYFSSKQISKLSTPSLCVNSIFRYNSEKRTKKRVGFPLRGNNFNNNKIQFALRSQQLICHGSGSGSRFSSQIHHQPISQEFVPRTIWIPFGYRSFMSTSGRYNHTDQTKWCEQQNRKNNRPTKPDSPMNIPCERAMGYASMCRVV